MKNLLASLVLLVFAMSSVAEVVIEYDNGYNLVVPEGWEVEVHPKGFNSLPYDPKKNPLGKAEGWQGWPWYTLWLNVQNCTPDQLVISPSVCPPQPRFVKPDTQCYFEPLQVPDPEPCLVISPATECAPEDL